MTKDRADGLRRILPLGALLLGCSCTTANLIVTDDYNLAKLTVLSSPSSVAGFTTYVFLVDPIAEGDQVTTIGAEFSASEMRQVNPNEAVTVFNDFNSFFDDPVDSDSQFMFKSMNGADSLTVVSGSVSESPTALSAVFAGFDYFSDQTAIAQVVLADGAWGQADISLVLRATGETGEGVGVTFSNVAFGAVAAVPEAALAGAWGVGVVYGLVRSRRLRGRR